jgi:hypothetical protein
MLHREYFPFLPTAESTPQGPIHPPLLEAEAPPGWWEDSAKELYGAAEQITCLLQEASECGIPLMTPFSGFCAFTACFLNLYIFRFPKMNLGRSPRAEQLMNWGLEYLEEFQNAWELAGGWVRAPLSLEFGARTNVGRLKPFKTRRSYTRAPPRIADGFGEDREPTLRLCTNPSTSTAS